MKAENSIAASSMAQPARPRIPKPRAGLPRLFCFVLAALSFPSVQADDIRIAVGITPGCPYGLSACWGGAYEALGQLDGVDSVAKEPDVYNCTALVRTKGESIPDPEKWREQFAALVGKQYVFRGVELTIEGKVEEKNGSLFLITERLKQAMPLLPLLHKLQWNFAKQRARGPEKEEEVAYQELVKLAKTSAAVGLKVKVTGPVQTQANGTALEVREFFVQTTYTYSDRQY